jgi:hypothetical protein
MLCFTVIARRSDGLALAADTETNNVGEMERHKMTAKNVLKKLASNTNVPPLMSIETASHHFHVLTEGSVFFLTMCEPSCSPNLAFSYLEDSAKEFLAQYGAQVDTAKRPYCFIKFDLFLQKTKKIFVSSAVSGPRTVAPRPGRPDVVRRPFRDVMGYGDAPSTARKVGSSSGTDTSTMAAIAAIAFAILLVILFLVYALME